jgi:hypothetical protein
MPDTNTENHSTSKNVMPKRMKAAKQDLYGSEASLRAIQDISSQSSSSDARCSASQTSSKKTPKQSRETFKSDDDKSTIVPTLPDLSNLPESSPRIPKLLNSWAQQYIVAAKDRPDWNELKPQVYRQRDIAAQQYTRIREIGRKGRGMSDRSLDGARLKRFRTKEEYKLRKKGHGHLVDQKDRARVPKYVRYGEKINLKTAESKKEDETPITKEDKKHKDAIAMHLQYMKYREMRTAQSEIIQNIQNGKVNHSKF